VVSDTESALLPDEESKFNSLVEYNEYYRKIYSQSGAKVCDRHHPTPLRYSIIWRCYQVVP
jgi:hypothetical protein